MYLADFDDQRKIRHVGSHLECFVGGNWLLGNYPTNALVWTESCTQGVEC